MAELSPNLSPDLTALGEQVAAAMPPGAVLEAFVVRGAELTIRIRRDAVLPVMAVLRTDPRFAFEQCMDLCGVDWPERAERFDVVWNLLSLTHNHRIRVVTTTDAENPVPSVTAIWPTAGWFEREAWDMYGIAFEGNVDLRRLLTDYGFQGHPLRKDFPLTGHVEVRYDPERREVVYEPVKLQQDFRNFDFLSPWEGMTTLPGDEKVHLNRIAPPPASLLEKPEAENQP
ncbi:NADH-quinone oxidoreductase subunit C [Pararoseomonas baculiformis]|uniref:NADH-quinone oxidoreductase subunit C n=1 Tax=Pararoseomonas baculiformis TaxID=2820812 RepID=UPI003157F33B